MNADVLSGFVVGIVFTTLVIYGSKLISDYIKTYKDVVS